MREQLAKLELRAAASAQLLLLGWWPRQETVAVFIEGFGMQICVIGPHVELHRPSGAAALCTAELLIN